MKLRNGVFGTTDGGASFICNGKAPQRALRGMLHEAVAEYTGNRLRVYGGRIVKLGRNAVELGCPKSTRPKSLLTPILRDRQFS
jgi:hypothetical protein